MMNKTQATAANARRSMGHFKAIFDVLDELDRIGSLEQAEAELKARIGRVRTEADGVERDTAAAKAKAEAIVAGAEARAADIIGRAEADARQAETRARELADGIVTAAETEAKAVKARAEASLAEFQAKCGAMAANLRG